MNQLLSVALLASTLSGCIIYEHRYQRDRCVGDCTTVSLEDSGIEQPPEPEPQILAKLGLTVSEAHAGDSLLSSLVVLDGELDLATVRTISFARDTAVHDQLLRDNEIVLLLEVAATAQAGPIDVWVELDDGAGLILDEPLQILAADGGACLTDSGTVDTGCP